MIKKTVWAILLFLPLNGHSSYCPYVVINKQFEIADIVFIGRVESISIDSIDIKTVDSLDNVLSIEKHPFELAKINIQKVYKGQISGQVTFTGTHFHEYPFRAGEKYLIFGRRHKKTNSFVTNWCNGTNKLTASKQNIEWLETRQTLVANKKYINADNLTNQSTDLRIHIKDSGLISIEKDSIKNEGFYKIKPNKIIVKFINYDKGKLYKLENRTVFKIANDSFDSMTIIVDNKKRRLVKQ
jgi:hypothetical protein